MPPLRYEALANCLTEVMSSARIIKASVHMPRIGCGLAGGKWERVGPMVEGLAAAFEVDVYVYDLPGRA